MSQPACYANAIRAHLGWNSQASIRHEQTWSPYRCAIRRMGSQRKRGSTQLDQRILLPLMALACGAPTAAQPDPRGLNAGSIAFRGPPDHVRAVKVVQPQEAVDGRVEPPVFLHVVQQSGYPATVPFTAAARSSRRLIPNATRQCVIEKV